MNKTLFILNIKFFDLNLEPTKPDFWVVEAVNTLQRDLVYPKAIFVDKRTDIGRVGQSINVTVPRTFGVAKEFSSAMTATDKKADFINIPLEKHFYQAFELVEEDMRGSANDLINTFLVPAVQSVAKSIDKYIADLCLQFPYYYGTPGTTPSSIDDIIGIKEVLDDNEVPDSGRSLILNSTAEAKFLAIPGLISMSDNIQGTMALKEGKLGTIMNFEVMKSNNNPSFTSIADVTGIAVNNTAGYAAGIDTIAIDDGGAGAALAVAPTVGMILSFAGHSQPYSVIASTTTSVKIFPALQAAVVNDEAITFVGGGSKLTRNSIALHNTAIAMVMRELSAPTSPAVQSASFSNNGISMRVTTSYDHKTQKYFVSVESIVGARVVDYLRGARLLG